MTRGGECVYMENGRPCHDTALWIYPQSPAHPEWPLCDRHARPEFWPIDIRMKLPGLFKRLATGRGMDGRA